jgi:hypothetical protein
MKTRLAGIRSAPNQIPGLYPMKRPSRRKTEEALDYVPIDTLLLGNAHRELTHKQKVFARELAMGAKGAEAYRKAYNARGMKKTHADNASRLKNNSRVVAETNRQKAIIEAKKQRTPEELRIWVIEQLKVEANDQDNPPSVRINALQMLGKVTEVAAFTERKERVVIHSSLDLRAKIEQSIKELTIEAEDIDALSLEHELRLNDAMIVTETTDCLNREDALEENEGYADPTGEGEGQSDGVQGASPMHNSPPKQLPSISATPPPSKMDPIDIAYRDLKDPPGGFR